MRSNPQHNQNPYAVVIGLDSLQGLQTARILAQRQIPVLALAKDPTHYGCQTNVCQRIIFTNTDGEELIRTLATLGATLGRKAVLFPCEDANVLLVSQHRQRLARWYHIVLPAPEVVEQLIDKANFYAYAQENGFPIPRTFLIQSQGEAEALSQRVTFPCILKPPISAAPEWENNTLQKAFKVEDAAQLLRIYDHFKQWSNVFIVQEWIEGPETNHYTCNCYFDQTGEPVVTFVTRKIRQWPPQTGQACLGVECKNDMVLHETLRLFRSVNYRGLGYAELKHDERTGQYFFIEPNIGRPTGRSATAEAGGVELLYTMYCDALGWPLPPNREQQYTGVKWIYLRQDLQAALSQWRQGELTLKAWWQSWQGKKVHAIFSWRDPKPFWYDFMRVGRLLLSAQERRKRDYQQPVYESAGAK